MVLHVFSHSPLPHRHQLWRGLRPLMHLHQKRLHKSAGVAGRALRAMPIKTFTSKPFFWTILCSKFMNTKSLHLQGILTMPTTPDGYVSYLKPSSNKWKALNDDSYLYWRDLQANKVIQDARAPISCSTFI